MSKRALTQEMRLKRIQEERLGIRAICSTLVAAFGVDAAIGALKDEHRELLQMKSELEHPIVSEDFERALSDTSTICGTCEFCGRTYFVSYGDYDHGELENLREKAKKEPKKYIEECRYDQIDIGYIDGKQAVMGCDCKKLAVYERWIWNHRWTIARYFELRAKEAELEARFAREISDKAQSSAA